MEPTALFNQQKEKLSRCFMQKAHFHSCTQTLLHFHHFRSFFMISMHSEAEDIVLFLIVDLFWQTLQPLMNKQNLALYINNIYIYPQHFNYFQKTTEIKTLSPFYPPLFPTSLHLLRPWPNVFIRRDIIEQTNPYVSFCMKQKHPFLS